MKYWLSACGLISAAMADPQAMLVGGGITGERRAAQLLLGASAARAAARSAVDALCAASAA